jgi:uncharacterized protein YqeY
MSLFRPMMLRTQFIAAARPAWRSAYAVRFSSTSTSTTETIVLPRLQSDLKMAMRAKNKPALNVIRALQAEIINASKTAKPIETDGALYALVQKQIKSSSAAIDEFTAAKRDDLISKEQEQLNVLRKYSDEIPKVAESEVDSIIGTVVAELQEGKKTFGSIMGKVMGAIKGRPYDIDYVQRKIEEIVGKK